MSNWNKTDSDSVEEIIVSFLLKLFPRISIKINVASETNKIPIFLSNHEFN